MKKILIIFMFLFLLTGCGNKNNELVMVTEAGFAPYEYYEDGKIVGVDVDIANEIAKKMGKKKIIAETGAGQHGVATATVAALLGLECEIFMGETDMFR